MAVEWTVPPNIVDSGTTDGVVAREGSNVSLSCRATGHPEPNITWRREDGAEFVYNGVPGSDTFFLSFVFIPPKAFDIQKLIKTNKKRDSTGVQKDFATARPHPMKMGIDVFVATSFEKKMPRRWLHSPPIDVHIYTTRNWLIHNIESSSADRWYSGGEPYCEFVGHKARPDILRWQIEKRGTNTKVLAAAAFLLVHSIEII